MGRGSDVELATGSAAAGCGATKEVPYIEVFNSGAAGKGAARATPAPTKGDAECFCGVSIKWFVLVFLVAQNSAASLLMRYSRSAPGGHDWNPQTGVIMQEVLKGAACVVLLIREGGLGAAFADGGELLKTGVPSLLYLVQNNMQYVAVAHLNAPTYAVLYQTKILSTAIFSVCLLRKQLSQSQWIALLILTVGVSMVTVSQMTGRADPEKQDTTGTAGLVTGLSAVLLAATTSGLAGVYFEKILKGSQVTLWARNLQMALYSIVIGIGVLLAGDLQAVQEKGFFHGYNAGAWLAIGNNAFGGLLIAVVIKFTDNILKNFAQGASIIFTAVASAILFGSALGVLFGAGVGCVIYSIFLYGAVVQLPAWLPHLK